MDLSALIGPKGAPGYEVKFRVFPRRGTERWMLETRFRRPWHLETWPLANRRARAIYRVAWLFGAVGIHLPSRKISLMVGHESLYQRLRSQFKALGVFLGTPGPNRKLIVYAKDDDKAWFIKVPINPETAALAQAEAATLAALADDPVLSGLVPRCYWIGDALAIENVRASGAAFAPLDDDEILRVHNLLHARSRKEVSLAEMARQWEAHDTVTALHPSRVIAGRIDAARKAAREFLQTLPTNMTLSCYAAHGDFTPWNVLRAPDGSARIIDWELYGLRPKFFDPFHYRVSPAILVDRVPADTILAQAWQLAAPALDGPSTLLYFGAYVACQVFYYGHIYERQEVLHPQAFWQLQTWTDLLTRLIGAQGGKPTDWAGPR